MKSFVHADPIVLPPGWVPPGVIDPNNTGATGVNDPNKWRYEAGGYSFIGLLGYNDTPGEVLYSSYTYPHDPYTVSFNTLSIGYDANGILTIDGYTVQSRILENLYIGDSDQGTLNITRGARLGTGVRNTIIGSGSHGTLNVDGQGSRWEGSRSTNYYSDIVGYNAVGTVNLTNGGTYSNIRGGMSLGFGAKGTLNVKNGGTVEYIRQLDLGVQDEGELNIESTNGETTIARTGRAYLGTQYQSDSYGTASVSGDGAVWRVNLLYVGSDSAGGGGGTLNIKNGAVVNVLQRIEVAKNQLGTNHGTINLDGGTLNTFLLDANRQDLHGTGTINTNDLIGDGYDTVDFNGSNKWSTYVGDDEGITLNLTATNESWLVRNMIIRNGAQIESAAGSFTDKSVEITGEGSQWTTTTQGVTLFGSSKLAITQGGKVATNEFNVNDSEASAKITGPASTLEAAGLSIKGQLKVEAGGKVNLDYSASVISSGSLTLMVDGDNMINAGTSGSGRFGNFGTVNLFATPDLAAGTVYSPISTATGFNGSGTYEAFGGTWDSANHTFTAAEIGTGALANTDLSGVRQGFDGNVLIVSFSTKEGTGSFDAMRLANQSLNIGHGQLSITAYDFITDVTELTLISIYIGEGFDLEQLSIWHLADGASLWNLHTANDFTYANGWISFTAGSFSSYAVTVPEPSTTGMLFVAGALLAARRRKS